MSTWCIVPIKRLDRAKSSLALALEPETRRELVLAMLEDVARALTSASSVAGLIVVSPDREVLDFARKIGAECICDNDAELNDALTIAVEKATGLGASSVLILPGDVPLVKTGDIENIISMASGEREVVISPSKTNGTDALLIKPPGLIKLRFGGESFPLHIKEASEAGVVLKIYRSPNLANDLDDPGDIAPIVEEGRGTKTHQVLIRARVKPYLLRK